MDLFFKFRRDNFIKDLDLKDKSVGGKYETKDITEIKLKTALESLDSPSISEVDKRIKILGNYESGDLGSVIDAKKTETEKIFAEAKKIFTSEYKFALKRGFSQNESKKMATKITDQYLADELKNLETFYPTL